jgi:hypothetical protein
MKSEFFPPFCGIGPPFSTFEFELKSKLLLSDILSLVLVVQVCACTLFYVAFSNLDGVRGTVVVKAQYYKPESRGFGTGGCEKIFSIYLILSAALCLEVFSASNRNEYQKQKNNISGE